MAIRIFLLKLEIRSMERGICPIAVICFAVKRSFFNFVGQQQYQFYHILGHVTSSVTWYKTRSGWFPICGPRGTRVGSIRGSGRVRSGHGSDEYNPHLIFVTNYLYESIDKSKQIYIAPFMSQANERCVVADRSRSL